jgi:predicted transglutaminase-like cysteine proteinase
MKRVLPMVALLVQGALFAGTALADPARTSRKADPSPFMRVFGATPPPFGFVQMCERQPAECAGHSGSEPRFVAGPLRLTELDEVNRAVNAAIQPATDQELYGVAEYWTLPTDKGDCEDYALLKRQLLIRRGWPPSALLLTVVRDERGDGHAVLTARTAQGDFILDNKLTDVRLWHQTGYRYVMRQSFVEPRLWMSLEPFAADRMGTLTSARGR